MKLVIRSVMDFALSDGSELILNQELIMTDLAGEKMLYVLWVDQQFACPWFKEFEDAIAANPFPLPFNEVD